MRLDVTLRLQTIKRGIYRTDGNLSAGARFNLLPHGNPISPITQAQERQDDDVLEFTKVIAVSH